MGITDSLSPTAAGQGHVGNLFSKSPPHTYDSTHSRVPACNISDFDDSVKNQHEATNSVRSFVKSSGYSSDDDTTPTSKSKVMCMPQ